MKILVGCEFSGTVRDAFAALGHDAWSCDLLPTTKPGNHIQGNVLDHLRDGWDMAIFHPDCTYLCSSGLHWNKRVPGRAEKTEQALDFVRTLMAAPIRKIVVENPAGCIGTRIMPADQYIQPYEFGEDASKKTGLWLKGVCPLIYGLRYPGRWVRHNGRLVERWSNQTDSGQNRLGPDEDRWADRALTYSGIASAMASRWGGRRNGP